MVVLRPNSNLYYLKVYFKTKLKFYLHPIFVRIKKKVKFISFEFLLLAPTKKDQKTAQTTTTTAAAANVKYNVTHVSIVSLIFIDKRKYKQWQQQQQQHSKYATRESEDIKTKQESSSNHSSIGFFLV